MPRKIPDFNFVNGPQYLGLSPKGAWRKPVLFKHATTGVKISLNCYNRAKKDEAPAIAPKKKLSGTPFMPLLEPDFHYQPQAFHELKAAAASEKDRDVFVFRDGDLLFKIETNEGDARMRQRVATTFAEEIWKFRLKLPR